MTTFDDLRSEFKVARETSIDYYRRCDVFARSLSGKLRDYLGAPVSFKDMKGETAPYIDTAGVQQQTDGTYKSVDDAGFMKLARPDEDGYCLTGLKIILDVGPNTWPKQGFLFLIRFIIRENECEMYVADSKQADTFRLDDPNGLHPAFDLIVQSLKKAFAQKPWDGATKETIGFVNLGETRNK
jgi:hypothetical protein